MTEEWREIPDFDGYKVSNHGRIGSIKSGAFKIMRLQSDKYGYKRICLRNLYKKKCFKVHNLVLTVFGPEKEKHKLHCGHNDGNASNNHIDNLRWVTIQENCADKIMHGRTIKGIDHHSAKLKESDVFYIRENYRRFDNNKSNAKELSQMFNVHQATINQIVKRKYWKHL